MVLLQAAQLEKSYGTHMVFTGLNLTIAEGECAGIVGINGAGKSTLLKILTGELPPDKGEVIRAKNLSLAYLPQEGGLDSDKSIWDELVSVFAQLIDIEKQLRALEAQMADASQHGTGSYRQLLDNYDQLSALYKSSGGFTYESSIRGVLNGLKFSDVDLNTPVNTLSGGQKTRLSLARCLLREPDLLILDEPTNYLDMDNLAWLEQYLQSFRGAVLMVSHDRYLLDALATTIYELTQAGLTRYSGNYSSFIEQKALLQEQQLKNYERQQQEIARQEDFIQRNMARKSTTKRAQSRLKALEKIERLERPEEERRVALSFRAAQSSGKEVLQVSNLSIGYSGQPLLRGLSFLVTKGERVALIGPNGIGKSTLLKTIAKELPPLEGQLKTGHKVEIGYYDQEQRSLSGHKQVLDELWDRYPHLDEVEIRTVLGRFLFPGDGVKKCVGDLSGGEKARLTLAALMLKQANFLILDEPTNHLDLPAREVLEEALQDYQGTIIFVSHDRYFINKTATRVMELSPAGVASYLGNYDYYLFKKAEQKQQPNNSVNPAPVKEESKEKKLYQQKKEAERQKRFQQRRINDLELSIAGLESDIARREAELFLPEVYQDYQIYHKKEQELEDLRQQLNSQMEQWLDLVESQKEEA
ncbi:MAG: ABC-F family ATP-binding cassette domain-containing protein [Pelotomaculum sp.]